jgi:hypothetical protein
MIRMNVSLAGKSASGRCNLWGAFTLSHVADIGFGLTGDGIVIRRMLGLFSALLVLAAAMPAAPAGAEGFFESLFGGGFRRPAPPPLPSNALPYADPNGSSGRDNRRSYGSDDTSGSGGHGTAYCVRTCDGR